MQARQKFHTLQQDLVHMFLMMKRRHLLVCKVKVFTSHGGTQQLRPCRLETNINPGILILGTQVPYDGRSIHVHVNVPNDFHGQCHNRTQQNFRNMDFVSTALCLKLIVCCFVWFLFCWFGQLISSFFCYCYFVFFSSEIIS